MPLCLNLVTHKKRLVCTYDDEANIGKDWTRREREKKTAKLRPKTKTALTLTYVNAHTVEKATEKERSRQRQRQRDTLHRQRYEQQFNEATLAYSDWTIARAHFLLVRACVYCCVTEGAYSNHQQQQQQQHGGSSSSNREPKTATVCL